MLSETLYELRKKSGLSQEQLAEQLDVSRQSVSKWENGTSVPETEKLIAISRFFHVSLDELLTGEIPPPDVSPAPTEPVPPEHPFRTPAGVILALAGMAGLIVWGILLLVRPETAGQLAESSVIRIDGNGIFLVLCLLAMAAGIFLLVRKK